MKRTTITIVILSLLLALSIIFQCNTRLNNKRGCNGFKSDTVTIVKVDTVTFVKPVVQKQYIKSIITDTLYSKSDTSQVEVYIPIETKVYQDSIFRAVVSGYRVSLDSINVYPSNRITTITNTNIKKRRFAIGIQTGVGFGIIHKRADLYLGLGITYRLF